MTLYITEKHSQVAPLKKALGNQKDIQVTNLVGHIVQLLKPDEYDNGPGKAWASAYKNNKFPFCPDKWVKKMTPDKKDVFNKVKKLIKESDEIILAPDPDNEGVTLAMELVEMTGGLDKVKGMINMSKLDHSSLTKEIKIINKIPYERMYQAGLARSYIDWLTGMNLTSLATVIVGNAFPSDQQPIHFGGVKSPTIRMVVERDLQFESFDNIPFWQIKGIGKCNGKEFPIEVKLEGNTKFDTEKRAQDILNNLISKKTIVNKYSESNKKTQPPAPYSLTQLQVKANSKYKYKADEVLTKMAQPLYESGFQSYPRTDCNFYAEGSYEEVSSTLDAVAIYHSDLKEVINNIKPPFLKRPIFDDSKVSAHTALSPTSTPPKNISTPLDRIYKMVAERYVIQFLNDYEYLNIKGSSLINIDNEEIEIAFSENVTTNIGWKIIGSKEEEEDEDSQERSIPKLSKNDELEIISLDLKKGETKPKPRFKDGSLLTAMENISKIFDDEEVKKFLKGKGIGTVATRANILQELIKGGYFTRDKKGNLISTEKSRKYIDIIPKNMTSPVLRANMEASLTDILDGKAEVEGIVTSTMSSIKEFKKELEDIAIQRKIPASRAANFKEIEEKCPKCSANLKEGDKAFRCSKTGKWDAAKKKWTGECDFQVLKNVKPLGITLDKNALNKLLSNNNIENEKGSLKLDLKNPPFFLNLEYKQNLKPKETLKIECPLCQGAIIKTDKQFRCSNTGKWDAKKKKWDGKCDFIIWREMKKQNVFIEEEHLSKIFAGDKVEINNNSIYLDKKGSPYFIKIDFKK